MSDMNWNNFKDLPPAIKDFRNKWLRGTTCHSPGRLTDVVWLSDCGRFFIMKHKSHSSYIDRMSGSENCPAFYCLYDSCDLPEGDCWGNFKPMKKWEGRWLNAYTSEVISLIAAII